MNPPPNPTQPSGLLNAGTILLLVGAILSCVGALALVVFGAFFTIMLGVLAESDEAIIVPIIMGIVYIGGGLLMGVGAIFGFRGYGRAKAGDAHAGWINGLVSALLPPLQVVNLIGAVLCMVSPEGEAAKRARAR